DDAADADDAAGGGGADGADGDDFDTPPAAATQSAGGAPAAAQSAGGAPAASAEGAPAAAPEPADTDDDLHARSAFAQLASVLPALSLTRSYRAGGEGLAELVNRRFYGGRIDALPWAGSFLGHGSLSLDYIENGTGLPDPDT